MTREELRIAIAVELRDLAINASFDQDWCIDTPLVVEATDAIMGLINAAAIIAWDSGKDVRWAPVTERIPPDDQPVLAIVEAQGSHRLDVLVCEKKARNHRNWIAVEAPGSVTHWRPLPPLPEEMK